MKTPMTTEERFFAKTVLAANGCLEWTGSRDRKGYGKFKMPGSPQLAHRVAWELKHGPIPAGMHVLHHCDNPPCVLDEDLFLGTALDNARDREQKGRGHQAIGERTGAAKLTEADVREIRRSRRRVSIRELAGRFGVSSATVWQAQTGRTWQHVT